MEAAFGTSFEHVRVHTDDQAARSAESVGANAYTVGADVVFRGGQYSPGTPTGQRTIAHELAHVVQQRQGPVDGTPIGGGISVSDPGDRFERAAEATADAVLATGRAPDAGSAAAPSVQREVASDEERKEEDVQALAIQRQEVPEEEEI
jgi:hypothetical protein